MADNEYEGETSDIEENEQRGESEIDGEAAEEIGNITECPEQGEQLISRKHSKKSKAKKRRKRSALGVSGTINCIISKVHFRITIGHV